MADYRQLRIFFQDESRIGLHLPSSKRITAKGIKPIQKQAPIYEYYWLYGVVEPYTGESFYLEIEHFDGDCFEVYLQELSKAYPDDLNVVIADNAPAHKKAGLKIPANIQLVFLPPYSPELNPTERLWEDLKYHICLSLDRIQGNLENLKQEVAHLLNTLYDKAKIQSLCQFPFLMHPINSLY